MRDDNQFDQRGNARNSTGGVMLAALAAAVVIIALIIWMPWNKNRTAENTSPGTTVGQSSRPEAPAPAPAAPAPSTKR